MDKAKFQEFEERYTSFSEWQLFNIHQKRQSLTEEATAALEHVIAARHINISDLEDKNKRYIEDIKNNGASGVGGWLVLLIIGLVFLAPFFGFLRLYGGIMTIEAQNPNLINSVIWQTLKFSTWSSFIFFSMLGVAAGIGLAISKKISAVKRAKILIWVCGPVAQFITSTLIPALILGKSNATSPEVIGALLASFIGSAIWYAYLSKSKRIKNTYT